MAFGTGSQAYFANIFSPSSGGGGGSGSGEVMVYRPGGVTLNNVYATWAELYTAYSASDGQITIEIDDSIVTPAPIPAGAYTIRPDAIFKGIIRTPLVKTVLQFQDGATFSALPYTTTNLQIDSVSTLPAISYGAGVHSVIVDAISILTNTGPSKGLMEISGNGSVLFMLVHDFSLLQGGVVAYANDPGAGAPVVIALALTGTQTNVNQNVFASDPAANAVLGIDSLSDTSGLSLTQAGWGGTFNIGGAQPRTFWRPTTVNTGNTTATPGALTLVDPTGGTVDVSLPFTSGLVGGETVVVKNVSASAIPITVTPGGGDTVDGLAGAYFLTDAYGEVTLIADRDTSTWHVQSASSGAVYSMLIYRPGGTQRGNVFTDWTELYAVYSNASETVTTIEIDSTIVSPAIVPAGAYIWRDDLTMQGDYFLGSYLQLADNVVFNQLPFIDRALFMESVSSGPIIDLGNSGININVVLDNYSFLTANGTAPFIEQASAVFVVSVEARFGSGFQTGAMAVLNLTDPGAGVAFAHIGAFEGTNISGQIQDDTISSGGGNVQVDRELVSSSGQISNIQTGYTSALFDWMAPETFDIDDRVIFRPTDDVKIADYTASPSEVVRCDPTAAGFNVTLPDPFPPGASAVDVVYNGTTVIVKNVSNSANQITILPDGNSTIDGSVSLNMIGARLSVTLIYFGDSISGDWMVV